MKPRLATSETLALLGWEQHHQLSIYIVPHFILALTRKPQTAECTEQQRGKKPATHLPVLDHLDA